MKKVTCPNCGTVIIYQVNETIKENLMVEVTYLCVGCDIKFDKEFVN
jgi:predicted RNA-binding Zn-ribbon protein involved in translation (DUF1610 family)